MLDPKESHYIDVLTVEIKEKKRKTKKRETTYYIDNIPCLLLWILAMKNHWFAKFVFLPESQNSRGQGKSRGGGFGK